MADTIITDSGSGSGPLGYIFNKPVSQLSYQASLMYRTSILQQGADPTGIQSTNYTNIPDYTRDVSQASAYGLGSTAQGINSSAFGPYALASQDYSSAFGFRSQAIGKFSLALGEESLASAYGSIAAGRIANVQGIRSIGIGNSCYISASLIDSIVIGAGAIATASNQFILGSANSSITDLYLGRGAIHIGAASSIKIHASDGSGTDISGDDLLFYGGQPTGAGVPGIIALYTSIAGAAGSTLRTAAERFRINTAGDTVISGNIRPEANATRSNGTSAFRWSDLRSAAATIGTDPGFGAQIVRVVASDTSLQQASIIQLSTGDAALLFAVGAVTSVWVMGIDNSDSDKFKISNDITNGDVGASTRFSIDANGNIGILTGKITNYNAIATTGWGMPSIYGSGRSAAQTAAVASVAAYTVGAADGSFLVSANVNVTTSTTHNFTVTIAYTDETNTARTETLAFSQLAGTSITAITNLTGAGPYASGQMHIRCKASTSITIATTGTFTSVTYNVEGSITQIS